MYCSACGVAVTQGLSYCNYCGTRLNGGQGDSGDGSPEVRPEFLVAGMVGVFIFGLVATSMLLGVMKSVLNLSTGQILPFAGLCFLMMLGLEGLFVRLLFRRRRSSDQLADREVLKGHVTRELDAAQSSGLPEHVPSVTEHTTRAFDSVYIKQKSD